MAEKESVQSLAAVDAPTVCSVSILVFKSGKVIPELISSMETICKNNVDKLKDSVQIEVVSYDCAPFTALKSDVSSKINFVLKAEDEQMPNTYVRVARGRAVIEIYFQALKLDDSKVAEICEDVFAKLPAEMTETAAN
jgi:hypothetical protein